MPNKPKVVQFGTDAFGFEITGDPRNREPTHMRIVFPGGHVEVTRAQDQAAPDYWVHVYVNHGESPSFDPEAPEARIVAARLDLLGQCAGKEDLGDFGNPRLNHLAVKVEHGDPDREITCKLCKGITPLSQARAFGAADPRSYCSSTCENEAIQREADKARRKKSR